MPAAIILGSLLISISILTSGGIIKLKKTTSTPTTPTNPTTAQASAAPAPSKASLAQVKDAFNKSKIKFGDSNKKLVTIEVADPSCPYCHAAAGRNPELSKQMGSQFILTSDGGSYVAPVPELEKLVKDGKVAFAYIYFPGHGNGEMGAKALYCAFDQGKFWEVHNMLMSNNGYNLMNTDVKNDKGKSQLVADFLQPVFDPAAMKQCLDSGKYDSRLKEDMAIASSLNISGTPGFYLNDKAYAGAYNYNDMEPTVKSALGI